MINNIETYFTKNTEDTLSDNSNYNTDVDTSDSSNSIFDNCQSLSGIDTKEDSQLNFDFFDTNTEHNSLVQEYGSKNGTIEPTQQGKIGDCWLLTGVNALSYSEKGREIIENALEYNNDSTTVHFAVGDYTITDEELEKAKAEERYSTGDDDMVIIELAAEKFRNDIVNGELLITSDLNNNSIKNLLTMAISENGINEVLDGGILDEALFMFTGKFGELDVSYNQYGEQFIDNCLSDKEKQWLEDFKENGNKDVILTADLPALGDKAIQTKDMDGKDVELYSQHAYAIKEVTDDSITVINPWDSGEDIVLSKDVFYDTFAGISKIDIGEVDFEQDIIKKRNDIFPEDLQVSDTDVLYKLLNLNEKDRTFAVDLLRKFPEIDERRAIMYSNSGKVFGCNIGIDVTDLEKYAESGHARLINDILPDHLKESSGWSLFKHDTFENTLDLIDKYQSENKEELYNRIIDRHLILNPYIPQKLKGSDIYKLSLISDENWEKALEYWQSNPNIKTKEIIKLYS